MFKRCLALVFGFFALYALTAQRGPGWSGSDSAEFQAWILHETSLISGPHFSNAHPFYVMFARLIASTPFQVTLVSSCFGALAVGGFFLCAKNLALSILFGLSHMLWWNSCLAEVQTMNLALTVFEAYFLFSGRLTIAALLSGLHLGVHNFTLLNLPVYAVILGWTWWKSNPRQMRTWLLPVAAFFAGASFWIWNLWTRGPMDVLVGDYGAKVSGLCPTNFTLTAFNLALAALSFFVPVILFYWNYKRPKQFVPSLLLPPNSFVLALFLVNFLFFIRYFVPDQATFLLPSLFFGYLLLSRVELKLNRFMALAAMQMLLPLMAFQVLSQFPRPDWKTEHEGRNDAAYFALPWKVGIAK